MGAHARHVSFPQGSTPAAPAPVFTPERRGKDVQQRQQTLGASFAPRATPKWPPMVGLGFVVATSAAFWGVVAAAAARF